MYKNNKSKFRILTGLIVGILMITMMTGVGTTSVQADTGSGGAGGAPTKRGGVTWRQLTSKKSSAKKLGSTNLTAFQQLMETSDSHRGYTSFKYLLKHNPAAWVDYINKLPSNIPKLGQMCEKSDVIWYVSLDYYGISDYNGLHDIADGGPGQGGRPSYAWATSSRNTHKARWMKYDSSHAMMDHNNGPVGGTQQDIWKQYLNFHRSSWNGGVQVIVCSATFEPPKPVVNTITVTADSHTEVWNGKTVNVTGAKLTKGTIKPGDELVVEGKGSGTYPTILDGKKLYNPWTTKITSAKVMRGSKDVTNAEYIINKVNGTLDITHTTPATPGNVDVLTQCIVDRDHEYRSSVKVRTKAAPVTISGLNNNLVGVDSGLKSTKFGTYVSNNKVSGLVGKTIDSWDSWLANAKNNNTPNESPTIDLGVNKERLSTHGGVMDISRIYKDQTHGVKSCQPQIKGWNEPEKIYTTVDGKKFHTGWTSGYHDANWSDNGARKITSSYVGGESGEFIKNKYQILGVNCNIDGLKRAHTASGAYGSIKSYGSGEGNGAIRSKNYAAGDTMPLGRSGETSNSKFFTDGPSCKEAFKCTANKLTTANHDAKNNTGDSQLFTSKELDGSIGNVKGNYLTFFRDNEDREVRTDLWYPSDRSNSDLNVNSNTAATSTEAMIYSGGTPEVADVRVSPSGSEDYIDFQKSEVKKTWSESVNELNIRSQWSSQEGKPIEVGLSWKYTAEAENYSIGKVNGDGVQEYYSKTYTFPIYCGFENVNRSTQVASAPNAPHRSNSGAAAIFNKSHAVRTLFTRSISDSKR